VAALLASALAGVLAGASLAGVWGLAAGVALVQVLLLVGLVRTADVPAGRSNAGVALVAGLASSVYLALRTDGAFDDTHLTALLVAMGAGFVAMAVVQLARRDGRARLTASLTFGVTALLLSVVASAWLALGDDDMGQAALLVGLGGAAVAAAIMIFPGPALLWVIGGTIGAASVGLIMQAYLVPVDDADVGPVVAAVVAGTSGVASTLGVWAARLLRDDQDSGEDVTLAAAGSPRLDHALVVAGLPLALAAPVVAAAVWAVAEGWVA
jgi:hypothetical protein